MPRGAHKTTRPPWTSEKPHCVGTGAALEPLEVFSQEGGGSLPNEPQLRKGKNHTLLFVFLEKRQKSSSLLASSLSEEASWGMGGWAASMEVL